MRKLFIGYLNTAYAISAVGLFFGLFAIALAAKDQHREAIACLVMAGLCDLLDCFVARRLMMSAKEKAFGVQIDSLVDVVCFGVAPAAIAYQQTAGRGWPAIAVLMIYMLCAVHRLAYFNITGTGERKGSPYYTGVPVT